MSTLSAQRVDTPATASPRRVSQPAPLANFWTQVRFMARRDRLRAPVWVLAFVGVVVASTASVVGLYSTPAELDNYATVAQASAAIKAVTGPGYGLDHPTQGTVVMNELALYTYVGVSLLCVFMLVRHTRAEEETDRAELVRAAPVGRYSALAAAIAWVFVLSLLVTIGNVIALVAFGLPAGGSLAYGAATLLTACVFIGVTAVAAQVASSARAALSLAGVVLAAFFLVRAVADMGNGAMTWLSPLGVALAIRPFADERWWVLVPLTILSAVLLVVAVVLMGRRDLGGGLLSQRPGPSEGAAWMGSPFTLAVRLQRASVIGWLVGIGVIAFFYGLVSDQAAALADNQAVADILAQAGEGTITEMYLATIMLVLALVGSGFTVSSVLRLRSEEIGLRAAPVLAMPVDRRRWLASHFLVAVIGSLLLMVVGGLMAGLGNLVQTGDGGEIVPLIGAALTMFVGLLVIAAFTVALVGISARWSVAAWGSVVVALVIGLLAETLGLAQWIQDVSPFEHLPALPAASFDVVPVLALIAVACALTLVGMVAIRQRDIG